MTARVGEATEAVEARSRWQSRARSSVRAVMLAGALLASVAATAEARPSARDRSAHAASADSSQPALTAFLTVTSTPPARLFVDGTDTGLTTPVSRFVVAVGHHTIRLVGENGQTRDLGFTVKDAGVEKKLSVTF